MAWIESHDTLAHHPKTKRLARELGVSIPCAVGTLHMLWWWAMDYAPDGDLSKYTVEDIADALLWEQEPQKLVDSLIISGFVDDDMMVHNWMDYAGRLIEKRKQNSERTRKSRERNAHVTHNVRETYASVTGLHNQTVLKEKDHVSVEAANERSTDENLHLETRVSITSEEYTPEFEEFWANYPRKQDKRKAFRVWSARLKSKQATPDRLILSAKTYWRECEVNGTLPKYMKLPATFLGPDKPYEEFLDRSPPVDDGRAAIEATYRTLEEKGIIDPFA